MHGEPEFDVSFDFRTDVPAGKDPDEYSARLRATHRMLWSKPLKSGTALELVIPSSRRKGYLLNAYPKGPELCFGSDAITHSYTTWTSWDLAAVTHHTDAMAKLAYEQIWKI